MFLQHLQAVIAIRLKVLQDLQHCRFVGWRTTCLRPHCVNVRRVTSAWLHSPVHKRRMQL